MYSICAQKKGHQDGFSIVEIMVALVIGLIVTLVIMQLFSNFEGQNRTTSGTAAAQTSGNVALYTIMRDLQMAGFGLLPAPDSPLECDPTPSLGGVTISPVAITDGGTAAGASDTISIRYGATQMGGIPSEIQAMVGNTATVDNNLGCRVNDVALLINGTTCAMTTVTAVSSSPNYRSISLQSATAVGVLGANLACLGAWTQFEYKVNNGNLERNGLPIVSGIVNIQAQYGISTAANSNHIEQWVDATGSTWAAPSVTDRNRIKGVRIAVVARNGQYEKTNVTEACSSITDSSPSGLCAWDATSASPNVASPAPVIDLSNVADWQRYRYKTYETIVPLRNMIWATKETL